MIQGIRSGLDQLEAEGEWTEQNLAHLDALEAQVSRLSGWILQNPLNQTRMDRIFAQNKISGVTIDEQEAVKGKWLPAGQLRPTLIEGVSID